MERQQSAIIELFVNGKRQCDIMRSLNIPKERRKFVTSTIQRYLETGSVKDKSRSGLPITVTTTRMKKIIRDRIRRNPRRSMRKLSSELKILRTSVHRIVKSSLGLSSYKRRNVHYLSTAIRQKRLLCSKKLFSRLAEYGYHNGLYSDEKLSTIEEVSNSQNDRILSSTSSTINEELCYVRRVQKPLSVMIWGGISCFGLTSLIFVPQGVKINSTEYQDRILEPVVKDLGTSMFNKNRFLFQQDGASSPYSSYHSGLAIRKIFSILSLQKNGHRLVQI
ncbi:MhmaT1 transposase [Oopsacas minuta]|uniref:MhmaT1 transposase n=1 Tax=Oopsacas minuta TaxID=111878 RepID=A0AAV7JH29_9METZ|nr:MhmaT1 transposase [Oopsacas minuta]